MAFDRAAVNALINRYAPSEGSACSSPEDDAAFRRALTHRSASADRAESSERTEFLGDAVLALAITDYLFRRYPGEGEGFMTRMRSQLVSGATLSAICARLPISSLLVTARPEKSPADLEDALEAFVGALFLRRGFHLASTWITNVFEHHVDFASIVAKQDNPKDVLNRYVLGQSGCLPRYETVPSSMPGRSEVLVRDNDGAILAVGNGENQRRAEADAARKALAYLGVHANV